jgi:hypothetical protein
MGDKRYKNKDHNRNHKAMVTKYGGDYNMTTQEAAEYLGMAPGTLAMWRYRSKNNISGNPPKTPKFTKTGGVIRYRLGDLECFTKEK